MADPDLVEASGSQAAIRSRTVGLVVSAQADNRHLCTAWQEADAQARSRPVLVGIKAGTCVAQVWQPHSSFP
jgi:hypothetical protein